MGLQPRFPPVLDNTIVSTFASCPMKCFNEHFLGLSSAENIHLIAGGAFAKGVEVAREAFRETKNETEALTRGAKALIKAYGDIDIRIGADDQSSKLFPKSFSRVFDAYLTYFGKLPLPNKCTTTGIHPLGTDPFKPLGNEFSAVVPLGITNPQTKEELVYSIRFDALVESEFGTGGLDEKTSSQLQSNWSSQWQLRSQFLNYLKVTQLHGIDISYLVARGVILQKTQFHFPEAIVMPPQAVIDRCWNDTIHRIETMVHYFKANYFPSAFNDACVAYGNCPFHELCQQPDPEPWYSDFNRSYWNPTEAKREIISEATLEGDVNTEEFFL